MSFGITCDANEESGLGEVLDDVTTPTEDHFRTRDYGADVRRIFVVLMCRDPALNFKRRIRFVKKTKVLYVDVMLNGEEMKQADHETRKRIVAEHLAQEIPAIVRKYKFKDFDEPRFAEDLKNWLSEWPSLKHTRVEPEGSSMRKNLEYLQKYGASPPDKTRPS
jgi:hypothetical protein